MGKMKAFALLAAVVTVPLTGCSSGDTDNTTAPAKTSAAAPSTRTTVAQPTTTRPAARTTTQAAPATFDAIMRQQGFSADQIETVDAYRQSACATLEDNPSLKSNWTASTVKSEVQDSYDITLGNDVVAAILKSC